MDPLVVHASNNTLLSKTWLSEKCKRVEVPRWVHMFCPEPMQPVGEHRHKKSCCMFKPSKIPWWSSQESSTHTGALVLEQSFSLPSLHAGATARSPYAPRAIVWVLLPLSLALCFLPFFMLLSCCFELPPYLSKWQMKIKLIPCLFLHPF